MSINTRDLSSYTLRLLPESNSETEKPKRKPIWSILIRCWELLCRYFITACWHDRRCKQYGDVVATDSGTRAERAASMSTRPDQEMKKRLKDHFNSHIQKWMDKDHPRFPWKAALHILLVGLVTVQGCIYVSQTSNLTSYLSQSSVAFKKYFTPGPVTNIYTLKDVYEQITHIVMSYYSISDQYVIPYKYVSFESGDISDTPSNLRMIVQFVNNTPDCKHENLHPTIYAPTTECVSNETAECCDNHTIDGGQTTECCCSIKDQVRCCIDEENIGRVSIISFNFTLFASFNEKDIEEYNKVKSFVHFDILLQSDRYSGIFVEVQINRKLIRYHRDNFMTTTTIVDIFVFILLILSSGTYFYSVCLTIKLCKDLKLHFSAFHKKHLRWKEISHLFNKWYILMLFTNTLIFSGTILKIITEYQEEIVIDLLETVRLLLGVGLLLLWCGLFGLLISFEPLNVLFITVSLALPSVLWFLCCVAIIFIAFSLCGWLVLSSYHPKFTTFWLSIESLFTILNGDDLYVTFEEFDSTFLSSTTEVFSKLYLALFIFIFIYIVLSLFIGIFSHAYESLSDDWRKRSRGFLRDWAEGKPNDDPTQSYPFPIPPLRKPVDDTAIEISDDSLAHNMVPVIELTTPNHDDHSAFVRSFNHSLSPRQIKLQVADPPKASRSEVDEARQRLAPTKVVDETEA